MHILYFSAEWCGSCKMMKPAFAKFVEEMKDSITHEIVDVESNSELSMQYNVRNIPAFVFVKDGKEVERLIGARPTSEFKTIVTKYESQN